MKKQSLFAQAMKGLIEASGKTLEEFAREMSVSPRAISRWLHDQVLPRPHHIKAAMDIVRKSKKADAVAAVKAFYEMAEMPAQKVTPLYGERIGRSIGCYVSMHCFEKLSRRILAVICKRSWRKNDAYRRKLTGFLLRTLPE